MKTLLQTSAYESPALMVMLFVVGTIGILMMLIIKPSERTKAPMHYAIKKRELPSDDHHERAAKYFWLTLITAIIIYYFI